MQNSVRQVIGQIPPYMLTNASLVVIDSQHTYLYCMRGCVRCSWFAYVQRAHSIPHMQVRVQLQLGLLLVGCRRPVVNNEIPLLKIGGLNASCICVAVAVVASAELRPSQRRVFSVADSSLYGVASSAVDGVRGAVRIVHVEALHNKSCVTVSNAPHKFTKTAAPVSQAIGAIAKLQSHLSSACIRAR